MHREMAIGLNGRCVVATSRSMTPLSVIELLRLDNNYSADFPLHGHELRDVHGSM